MIKNSPAGFSVNPRNIFISLVTAMVVGSTATQAQTNSTYAAAPPIASREAGSLDLMLALSVDHQLFFEAYNDYDDINGDGTPEYTYRHSIAYEGYFNNKLCYTYSSGVFVPSASVSEDGYCEDTVDGSVSTDGGWSGNFLNWVSMSRIDLVRSVLYGGYRSTDSASQTILERAFLPQDAHSYAKYYNGSDIAKLTSNLPAASTCAVRIAEDSASCEGYTFCNTSTPPNNFSYSQEVNANPLIRAVRGNYALWGSNERFQCTTYEELGHIPGDQTVENATGDYRLLALEFGVNGNNDTDFSRIKAKRALPYNSNVVDFTARVEVCNNIEVNAEIALDENKKRCKAYGSVFKPVGVLHQNELNNVNVGLMTGSYQSNKDWGVLRKNLASFADEINDNGTFKSLAGDFDESIVTSINALRIVDYQFKASNSDDNEVGMKSGTYNNSGCWWGMTGFNNGTCRNWGNPFGEILAESYRYLTNLQSGSATISAQVTSAGTEESLLNGLTVAEWNNSNSNNPLAACSKQSVLAFNASGTSYDDSLANLTTADLDLGGDTSLASFVDHIGSNELSTTAKYIFGELLADEDGTTLGPNAADGQCSAKDIPDGELSRVRGVCPETPRLDGTFFGAGLAFYAHNSDLIPDTSDVDSIQTYGVTLAGALPNIIVKSGTSTVRIVPSCRNMGEADNDFKGNCALVDFKPFPVTFNADNEPTSFVYYVGWEDSEQGGDFDLDISGLIFYEVVNGELKVHTRILSESTDDQMDFGYAISGVGAQDGVYFPSRVSRDGVGDFRATVRQKVTEIIESNGAVQQTRVDEYKALTAVDANTASQQCTDLGTRCVNSTDSGREQIVSFTLSTGNAPGLFLKDPLYYATKWGSFDKSAAVDVNAVPQAGQWESDRTDAAGDTLPRSYASIQVPQQLETSLSKIISAAVSDASVSTGTGSTSNTPSGQGLALQTFYTPKLETTVGSVTWTGTVRSLLRDKFGNLREDTNNNGRLDDPQFSGNAVVDKGVRFVFDEELNTIVGQRCDIVAETLDTSGDTTDESETVDGFVQTPQFSIDVSTCVNAPDSQPIQYLWDANDQLALVDTDGDDSGFLSNRLYTASGSAGRYIYTSLASIDGESNGVDNSTYIPFTKSNAEELLPYLDVESEESAANVIDFIRGKEGIDGYRSRTLSGTTYRLGDVINSKPTVVGRPNSTNFSLNADESYKAFQAHYAYRRQVAYVGGNDGMLHAFNVGYFNPLNFGFYDSYSGTDGYTNNSEGGPTSLGQELWAYVPHNLLPHLKWLAEPNYAHVYYMDGPVQTFDVKIFNSENADYPGGWGTIIVAGMRFGGGEYSVDIDGETETLRSGYVIFDVTNPNNPPKLLAEITHEDLGYTTSNVDIVMDAANDKWFLVFGSGPTDLAEGVSSSPARLFSFELSDSTSPTVQSINTGRAESFVGGLTVKDWNGDMVSDAVYFGVVGNGTADSPSNATDSLGALMVAEVDIGTTTPFGTNDIEVLLRSGGAAEDKAFSSAPIGISDKDGNRWIYAASGRFLVENDLDSIAENTLYGIKLPSPLVTTDVHVQQDDLFDTSDVRVFLDLDTRVDTIRMDDSSISDPNALPAVVVDGTTTLSNVAELSTYIKSFTSGWKKDFTTYESRGGLNPETAFLSPAFVNDTIFSSTFSPSNALSCEPSGRSFGYLLGAFSGVPQTKLQQPFLLDSGIGTGESEMSEVGDLAVDVPGMIVDQPQVNEAFLPTDDKGGELKVSAELLKSPPSRESWREIPLDNLR